MGFSGFRAYVEPAMVTASLPLHLIHLVVLVCICISRLRWMSGFGCGSDESRLEFRYL